MTAKRQQALEQEAHDLTQLLKTQTQQEVFAIARKTLRDLANTSLEERMGDVFTRHLREMDGPAKASLGKALTTTATTTTSSKNDPAIVRSAFDLPPEQRATIQNALNETFSTDIHLRFETAPELVSGIELTRGGQKVAWTIADYLASMEKHVADLLLKEDKKKEAPKQAPSAKTAEPASSDTKATKPKPEASTNGPLAKQQPQSKAVAKSQ